MWCLPLLICLGSTVHLNAFQPGDQLEYDSPASEWRQALPLVNGQLGAMVFGYPFAERIRLNEDSVWPGGLDWGDFSSSQQDLKQGGNLLRTGRNRQAESLIVARFSNKSIIRPHQTLGDLFLSFEGQGEKEDHRRSLSSGLAEALLQSHDGFIGEYEAVYAGKNKILTLTEGTALLLDTNLNRIHP